MDIVACERLHFGNHFGSRVCGPDYVCACLTYCCSLIYFSELHIVMAPKDHKIRRLRELRTFVCDPVRLQNLRGRSGDTLKEKLRVKVPEERTWQKFLYRTRFDADEQRVLEELNNLVTCRDDGLVGTSHGGAYTAANTPDATTTAMPTFNSDRGNSLSTRKRARDKKRSPMEAGSDGEAHVEAHVSSAPVGGSSGTPTEETHSQETHTQELALRGLCFQYPFSRLLLSGQQTIAARGYRLGFRNIVNADEEMFLIETPPRHVNGADLEGGLAGDPPREAQVVGTITFSKSVQYKEGRGVAAWKRDRHRHRIKEGSKLDWDGKREMHAWHVACVRRFQIPVPAGEWKNKLGYVTPRTLRVAFERDGHAPADAASAGPKRRRTRKQPEAPAIKAAKRDRSQEEEDAFDGNG